MCIRDRLYPDDGRIKTGPQVKEAYLPQIVRFDHPDWNLVENMMAAKKGLSAQSARNRLAAYDFRGEDVFKPVSVLSGGEQSRLRPVSYTHLSRRMVSLWATRGWSITCTLPLILINSFSLISLM